MFEKVPIKGRLIMLVSFHDASLGVGHYGVTVVRTCVLVPSVPWSPYRCLSETWNYGGTCTLWAPDKVHDKTCG